MRTFSFTVDVDRDVNLQIPGRVAAGSIDRGSGDAPRFSSTERGLGILLDILDEAGIDGTLFFEGRTAETIDCARASGHRIGLHGYDHEDLTALDDGDLERVLSRSCDAVRDAAGEPTCFRAPYMKFDRRVLDAVHATTGIADDSSFYTDPAGPWETYGIGGIREHPVAKSRDSRGKVIAAYLWPMHEGARGPEDYIRMAEGIDGDLVIADHTWHLVETRSSGPMGPEWERRTREDVLDVVCGILDLGFRPATLSRRPRFPDLPGPPSDGLPEADPGQFRRDARCPFI